MGWPAVVVLGAASACATSDSNNPNENGSLDAGVEGSSDVHDDTLDAAQDTKQMDEGAAADSQAEDSSVVCKAFPNGTCSPEPDPSLPMCNGCYGYSGRLYDLEARCLRGSTLVCTTVCTCFLVPQCYVRETDGSVEVIVLECHFESARFGEETGLTECDDALKQEVMKAVTCD